MEAFIVELNMFYINNMFSLQGQEMDVYGLIIMYLKVNGVIMSINCQLDKNLESVPLWDTGYTCEGLS